jgi:phage terminase large subunit-like protein
LRDDQYRIAKHDAKIKAVCCGRRWGKTVLGGVLALLVANAGGRVAWVVPTYRNGRPLWRWVEQAVAPLASVGVERNRTERVVQFPNGGMLGIYSADSPDSIRGENFNLVIVDEAARVQADVYTDVIQPTVADTDGDILLISTPAGKNYFYNEYQRGAAGVPGYASFHASSRENPNPNIRRAFDMARERVPERTFREEWLAEFVDDGGSVFRRINESVYGKLDMQTPDENRVYYMGLDWGQSNDFTVITVMDDTGRVVVVDRFNQIGWELQRGRVLAAHQRWKPQTIMAEANSIGSPNIEALQADGLPVRSFTTTNETKSEIVQALALAFEQALVSIPDYAPLLHELQAFEAERLPSGRWRYNAPSGSHDDCVISLALSYHAKMNTQPLTLFVLDW